MNNKNINKNKIKFFYFLKFLSNLKLLLNSIKKIKKIKIHLKFKEISNQKKKKKKNESFFPSLQFFEIKIL